MDTKTKPPAMFQAEKTFELQPLTKVRLVKTISDGNNNIQYPGIYNICEIPKAFRNKQYLTLPGSNDLVIGNTLNIQKEEIIVSAGQIPNQREPNYKDSPGFAKDSTKIKSPTEKITQNAIGKIDVNRDTIEQLTTLPQVGMATANLIVDERKKEPFANVADLADRVTMTRGEWEDISAYIVFSQESKKEEKK